MESSPPTRSRPAAPFNSSIDVPPMATMPPQTSISPIISPSPTSDPNFSMRVMPGHSHGKPLEPGRVNSRHRPCSPLQLDSNSPLFVPPHSHSQLHLTLTPNPNGYPSSSSDYTRNIEEGSSSVPTHTSLAEASINPETVGQYLTLGTMSEGLMVQTVLPTSLEDTVPGRPGSASPKASNWKRQPPRKPGTPTSPLGLVATVPAQLTRGATNEEITSQKKQKYESYKHSI